MTRPLAALRSRHLCIQISASEHSVACPRPIMSAVKPKGKAASKSASAPSAAPVQAVAQPAASPAAAPAKNSKPKKTLDGDLVCHWTRHSRAAPCPLTQQLILALDKTTPLVCCFVSLHENRPPALSRRCSRSRRSSARRRPPARPSRKCLSQSTQFRWCLLPRRSPKKPAISPSPCTLGVSVPGSQFCIRIVHGFLT
jgi:hypothetical protein